MSALTSVVFFSALDRWDVRQGAEHTAFSCPTVILGDVAQIRLGLQVPKKGSRVSGVTRPYLRAANVRRGSVDLDDVRTMHLKESQAADLELQKGDLLFVEGSGSVTEVGRTAIWDGSVAGMIHQNSVVRARLHDDVFDPEYAVTWFNSRAGNAYIREQATTTSGLYHIGAGKLAGAPIPVPPLDVQRQLVRDYRTTLKRAEDAEREATRLRDHAEDEFSASLAE